MADAKEATTTRPKVELDLPSWVVVVARFLQAWGVVALVGASSPYTLGTTHGGAPLVIWGAVVGALGLLSGTCMLRRAIRTAAVSYLAWVAIVTAGMMIAVYDPTQPFRILFLLWSPVICGALGYKTFRAIAAANHDDDRMQAAG